VHLPVGASRATARAHCPRGVPSSSPSSGPSVTGAGPVPAQRRPEFVSRTVPGASRWRTGGSPGVVLVLLPVLADASPGAAPASPSAGPGAGQFRSAPVAPQRRSGCCLALLCSGGHTAPTTGTLVGAGASEFGTRLTLPVVSGTALTSRLVLVLALAKCSPETTPTSNDTELLKCCSVDGAQRLAQLLPVCRQRWRRMRPVKLRSSPV
jgi:hypothetical protein